MARGRVSKATKKFQAKHLTHTLESRKIHKKNKDKYNKKNKDRSKTTAAAKEGAEEQHQQQQQNGKAKGKASLFAGMSMDEFLQTGGGGEDVMQIDEVDQESAEIDDEMEKSHKAGLEGLKEKDPAFYEFLKQNDRELLDFDPDELEEDEDEAEGAPVEGGLTVETLSRWEKLLKEEKSLATLKKVLIAVKNAASNVTGEEIHGGNAKYVLTDPEGMVLSS